MGGGGEATQKADSGDPGDVWPTNRLHWAYNPLDWLKSKAVDDDCSGLWRIQDSLYDFGDWVERHPGGGDWITLTKGTDITEAFETSHVFGVSDKILAKYWVREAQAPRKSRFTFTENGFFKTVQRRAAPILKEMGTGPTLLSTLTMDFLGITFLVLLGGLAYYPCLSLAVLAGIFLGMTSICAHNWFHLGDRVAGLRRFYFDLSLASSRDWRISHGLSHHYFTNMYMDIEISGFEPYALHFLPVPKGVVKQAWQHLAAHLGAFLTFPLQFAARMYLVLSGEQRMLVENLLAPAQLVLLTLATRDPLSSSLLWFLYHGIASYMLTINFSWTHHHPDLYHAGDAMRTNRDWGLHIIDTTLDFDRTTDTWGCLSTPLQLTTFGHHLLHHFFPTVDLSKLELLYPALHAACEEHGESYPFHPVLSLICATHAQLNRNQPNLLGDSRVTANMLPSTTK